jgi:phosphatidate cytidylyltransferase
MNINTHTKRILTSILLLPLLILLIYLGKGLLFNIFIIGCILICMKEFYFLMDKGGMPCFKKSGILLGTSLTVIFMFQKHEFILLVLTCSALMLFLNTLTSSLPLSERIPRLSSTLLGLIYIPCMMGFLILIRGLNDGKYLIFLILAIIWGGDTLAYYTGSLFGRHPLSKTISPKKTLEGMLGGLLGSILAALCLGPFWLPKASLAFYPFIGLTVGSFGQLGDLSESVLKRWAGEKESGNILPGHGGLLDRIDGLIFSAPVFYYLTLSSMRRM